MNSDLHLIWRRGAAAVFVTLCLALLGAVGPGGAQAQTQTFVPPPRSIADITAILESETPDAAKIARYVAQAGAQPRAGMLENDLARFYLERAVAASQLGRVDPFRTCGELLLDHLVGAAEQGHREGNTERASGLEIDE